MRAAVLALLLVALAAPAARAEPKMMFGPFPSDARPDAAVKANPGWDWTLKTDGRGAVVGAVAGKTLPFGGLDWSVTIGNRYGGDTSLDSYSVDLEADVAVRGLQDCPAEASRIVGLLEPVFGPFGTHPAFGHDGNDLYGGLGPFTLRKAGARSFMRDYGQGQATTFAEFDEAGGQSVMVGAVAYDYHGPRCTVRLHVFQSDERIERVARNRAKFAASGG